MNKWQKFWEAGNCRIIQEIYSKYEVAWIFIDGVAFGMLIMLIIFRLMI